MSDAAFEPDVAAALAAMRAANRPSFETLSVAEARAMYRAGRDTVQLPTVALASVEDRMLGGVPARAYRPGDAPSPGVILFIHGGGYVIGDLDTHDSICRHLALAADSDVVAIDYRLAPEHMFPAAFDDALAAYRALAAEGRRVALAGDSAGGALCLAVSIAARDEGLPMPVAQALFYPVTDIAAESASYASVTGVPIAAATMRWFWGHYLGDAEADWRASPLRAPSLADLPQSFVTIAGHDPLRDEGHALVDRLRDAGVDVVLRDLPGQVHGYLTLGRLIGEAIRSIAAAAVFIDGGFQERRRS